MQSEFCDLTAAVVVAEDPWRYAYMHASIWRHALEIGGFELLAMHGETIQGELAEYVRREESIDLDPRDIHWHAGWPLLSPEDFAEFFEHAGT